MKAIPELHNEQQVDSQCKNMTLGISAVNNTLVLHTRT